MGASIAADLLWTADGRRPWHEHFHTRDVGGRTLALWLGHWGDARIAACEGVSRAVPEEFEALSGRKWLDAFRDLPRGYFSERPSSHLDMCSCCGWIGIGFLPADPRPARAVWPGWRHIAHAKPCRLTGLDCDCWLKLKPLFKSWAALPDDELIALVGR